MKKSLAVIIALIMGMSLFVGCSTQMPSKEATEITDVLYVEKTGFITKLDGYICYVEYANADDVITVGDKVALTYREQDHLVTTNTQALGGYRWDTVLTKCSVHIVEEPQNS